MNEAAGVASNAPPQSIFQSNLPVDKKLEAARTELLDLSARNRLLNMSRTSRSARIIEVIDERSAEVFRMLVRENRPFTFLAGRASKEGSVDADANLEEILDLAQPDDDSFDDRGVLNRHSDTKLQTRLTSAGLQKRLLDLYSDARTLEEEQGVNVLFLALGTLRWIDPANAESIRSAPLILVPVKLERASAAERFKLKWRQEEHAANLSLEAYLDRVHSIQLPPLPIIDDLDLSGYFAAVAEVISLQKNWAVLPDDIVLGFFSFAKFLMYRDLDPEVWPPDGKLTEIPLIRSILADGFAARDDMISDDGNIDSLIPPLEMRHVIDSDSSQALAIHDVRKGHNLVIQGPPGTGKSQTITNIIADAIGEGKTVLFVAEKMAALDVVKRRLDQAGIGDACLELHSNKANKRLLLEELRRTWELGSPRGDFAASLNPKLQEARDTLNGHVSRMHRAHEPSCLTPYQVLGELVRIQRAGIGGNEVRLEQPEAWSPVGLLERLDLANELCQRLEEIGCPAEHAWWCVGLDTILPMQTERIVRRADDLKKRLQAIVAEQRALATSVDFEEPKGFHDFASILTRLLRISTAPEGLGNGLATPQWSACRVQIHALLREGSRHSDLNEKLRGNVLPRGWEAATGVARTTLEGLPEAFCSDAFTRARRLHILIPQIVTAAEHLRELIGLAGDAETAASISRTLEMGKHVASAPPATPETFTAAVWEHGIEKAADLVEAVASLEAARQQLGKKVSAAAWDANCAAARQTLASHGNSPFRFFNGEWRRVNRLVKSFLSDPGAPVEEMLGLLDHLTNGQHARAEIRSGDALGLSAFGSHWRGERSSSAPLRALVEWSRGLGPRSHEIRSIASRIKDSPPVRVSVSCLQAIWDEFAPLVTTVAADLGTLLTNAESGLNADRILLSSLEQRTGKLAEADIFCSDVMAKVPPSLSERLLLLDRLRSWQEATKAIADLTQLGKECFGAMWHGLDSQWQNLKAAAEWIDANSDIRTVAARFPTPVDEALRGESANARMSEFVTEVESLFSDLRLDAGKLFGSAKIDDLTYAALQTRLDIWIANREQLSKWVSYCERAKHGCSLGLSDLIDQLEHQRLLPPDVPLALERAYYEAVFADQANSDPMLARFDGKLHARLVQQFVELDLQRIAAARFEIVRSHHRRIPQTGGGIGPLGLLRAEIARRRGNMSIRQLMLKAGPVIQALKPVLMMSPLSVAQFLTPGQLKFDLLVMDEASQIQPVDALGAVARCRQVVVVGDDRQLPPTRFFSKMTGGQPEDDETEASQIADVESILGLFAARGVPQRMLRWHYRSRHPSLIAVSNSQFYDHKLLIVPSPFTREAGMGLQFHHIPGGVFDSGNSRTNAVEAKRVAEAVIEHARVNPHQSLGVATFSAKQRRAILDQLELHRRSNPDTEPYFSAHVNEPFFVKNLENIQGDERDIIFISVGYARNAQGQMSMAFGPLSSEGGERRLNVLISRAKRRCEVFASITDEDIDTERGKGKGVFAFKLFLHFARTGHLSIGQSTASGHDSVFEMQLAEALQGRGYQVHARVGISGVFIDLAVADRDRPGRYLLGIECDGISYRSARSARDRDRLRRSVLEDQGWIMHRVWCVDWFQRPSEQLELTIAAIKEAQAELDSQREVRSAGGRAVPVEIVAIEREDTIEMELVTQSEDKGILELYVEASPMRPPGCSDLLGTPAHILAQLVEYIVSVEGPVHLDEVTARVRCAWDLQRSGVRIQSLVESAVMDAIQRRQIDLHDHFLTLPGKTTRMRDRSRVLSVNLRKPEMLPPQEIASGVIDVVRANLGASQEQIVSTVLRLLGFRSTSIQLREVVQTVVRRLTETGKLTRQGELLIINESTVESAEVHS
jgi:very-short-patch-repair endonuclease